MKLTVKVKLLPTPEQKASLIKTIEVFNDACNYISKIAYTNKAFGQVRLHYLCYRDIREKFGLSAQTTVRAIGKVSESYKTDKKRLHFFKKHSAMVYDRRILSFKNLDTVSILSVDGRFKIPIVFGAYAKLEQRRIRGQADLIYQNGELYLCLVIELPDGMPIKAKGTERGIALEDLKGFRSRITVNKLQRERFGKWAFSELRNFICYKAQIAGVPVVFVNPKNTSRTCSQCGYVSKSNRKSQAEFVCKQCNYSLHADINGAKVVASRASVNTPTAV